MQVIPFQEDDSRPAPGQPVALATGPDPLPLYRPEPATLNLAIVFSWTGAVGQIKGEPRWINLDEEPDDQTDQAASPTPPGSAPVATPPSRLRGRSR